MLVAEKDAEQFAAFLNENNHGCTTFEEYLERCGGTQRIAYLKAEELQRESIIEMSEYNEMELMLAIIGRAVS
jgi:hypothetical protein